VLLVRSVPAFALAIFALVSSSDARDPGQWGGHGGVAFQAFCNANDVLIGLSLRGGTSIDAIVPMCTPLNSRRTEWTGIAYEIRSPNGGYFGGPGGEYFKVACDPGDAVHQLGVAWGPWSDPTIVKTLWITPGLSFGQPALCCPFAERE
jgi:hypothetical protein